MQSNSKRAISIALVDDHTIFRRGMFDILGKFESLNLLYDANNEQALIAQINTQRKVPDVCLVGFNTIKFNEHTQLSTLSEQYPNMKLLALSIYNNEFNIIQLLQSGANGFLSKNADGKELLRAILSVYYTGMYTETMPKCNTSCEPFVTEMEAKFLSMLSTDATEEEIAEKLKIKLTTLESYKNVLCEKLKVTSRIGLIINAHMMGISGIVKIV